MFQSLHPVMPAPVAAIHVFRESSKTQMAGISPAMTNGRLSASANSSTLIRADVCRLGDLRPARDLGTGPGVELLRGVALGVDAEAAGVLGELGRGDHRADVGRKLLQHRRRNAGGALPSVCW